MMSPRPLYSWVSSLIILSSATAVRAASGHGEAEAVGHHAAAEGEPTEHPTAEAAPEAATPSAPAPEKETPATPSGHAAPAATHAPVTGEHAAELALTAEDVQRELAGLQNLGVSLTERGDWDAAEIAFRQILKAPRATSSDLANALLGLARVYRRQGSYTKAAAIYERYLKDYPSAVAVPDALLELGRTQRALGAPQLALARFYNVINSTIKLSSENSEHYQVLAKTAQFEIAETHFQQGNYIEANKFFSRLRLLDLAPADRARAHFKSADALFRDKDYAGAVKTLTSFLEQCPSDENVPEARYLLSVSLRLLDRKQEALDIVLSLLRTEKTVGDPKRWSYWQRRTGNQLANDFFQSGDTLNALMIYQGLAALSPAPEWRLPVTYQIALCYERMRLYDRALAAYQGIVDGTKSGASTSETPAGEAKAENSAELTELSRMALWRISQLNWHNQTEQQLATLFTANGDPAAPKPANNPHALAPNIDTNVSSQPTPPSPPGNDHSGSSAKTSASL